MSMNDQINLMVLLTVFLQLLSLILLPKWWKVAACPPLILLVLMLLDLTSGANLAGYMTYGLLAPLAIGWLLTALLLCGIVRGITNNPKPPENTSSEDQAE